MRRVSASASAAATDGLLMCTIDSLCVSSNSSACANEALAKAANGAAVDRREPHTGWVPRGAIARTPRARNVRAPSGSRHRQTDHVEEPQLRGRNDVRRKIVEAEAGHPGRDLAGKRLARRNRLRTRRLFRVEMLQRPGQQRGREQEPAERDLADGEVPV